MPSNRIKVEPDASKEPGGTRGYARGAKEHFRFQVALIDSIVSKPWSVCFGCLGTGFVAVRSDVKRDVVLPFAESDRGVAEDAACATSGIPADATLVIFINAPAAGLQMRNGRTLGEYRESLDVVNRTLGWSAQRRDLTNRGIRAIMAHCNSGGRTIVSVRPDTIGPDERRHFRLLGQLSHIDNLEPARFLVGNGECILRELGTRYLHKEITAACLNDGLRRGVGLAAVRYKPGMDALWCKACCYAPPRAVLHFEHLLQDGIDAFERRLPKRKQEIKSEIRRETKREIIKQERMPAAAPSKRLRCKQPLMLSQVKRELVADSMKSSGIAALQVTAADKVVPAMEAPVASRGPPAGADGAGQNDEDLAKILDDMFSDTAVEEPQMPLEETLDTSLAARVEVISRRWKRLLCPVLAAGETKAKDVALDLDVTVVAPELGA